MERRTFEGETAQPLKPWLLGRRAGAAVHRHRRRHAAAGGTVRPPARARAAAGSRGGRSSSPLLAAVEPTCVAGAAAQLEPRRLAAAQTRDQQMAIQATGKVTFAYVLTGDAPPTRPAARACGPDKVLAARTAVEPGEPYGINIVTDEIAFFPILYWPVLGNAQPLTDAHARQDRRLHEAGRHDRFRYARLRPGRAHRPQRAGPRRHGAAAAAWPPRYAAPRAGAGGARADEVVLFAARRSRAAGTAASSGSRPRARTKAAIKAARRAAPTASAPFSSRPTIWPRPGRSMSATGRSIRRCRAARRSARWPTASASTSSCTR